MRSQRSIVDYALRRRAVLADVAAGRTAVDDVCDPHPDLLRAARYHGESASASCPICQHGHLTHVKYVYGDELGRYVGRVKQTDELAEMARQYSEFRVYVVEVCRACGWNHLTMSYLLGTGGPCDHRQRRTGRT
ncbi:MAG: hypothetical protein GEV11_00085 [Streptosporangiales bacterium]|nr:hypothetical protein [Streptosporangiales bacterium]